ncbi:MAG: hypothetical protein MJZ05_03080 [Fibrobacter sp.]|nr:hypothetical protein [Fibrobacter sp.]
MGKEMFSTSELKKYFNDRLGLKKVEFLGPIRKKDGSSCPLEKLRVYRYMHYPHVKEMLVGKNSALFFVSPEKWDDPMEKRFALGDYTKAKKFIKKNLACMCVSVNAADNEAAAWSMYDKDRKNDLVRLTYNFGELLKLLDDYVADIDAKVYVAGVNYVSVEEICSPKTVCAEMFSDEDFLKLMLLKRKSFMFEGEIRIMIYGNAVQLDRDKNFKVPLGCKATRMLKNIRIAPDSPDLAITKKKVIVDIGKAVKVNQSRLNTKTNMFRLK